MKIERFWQMPSKNTLSIHCFRDKFNDYNFGVSIDLFAKDCNMAHITNDLNKETKAQYHMLAIDFLKMLEIKRIHPNVVIYDPPYSLRQVKECYDSFGTGFTHKDSQNAIRWTIERDKISELQRRGDIVLSFGWSSTCMGKKRGYRILEIILCSHGSAHNDTICVIEEKE